MKNRNSRSIRESLPKIANSIIPAYIFALALIIFLGSLIYLNSLLNPFIWDDIGLVATNLHITDLGFVPRLFTENIYHQDMIGRFYRPLLMLSFALDYRSWGLDPAGYHLTSICLHLANAILIFCLVQILFGRRLLAFLTSLLFVLHPIHTEAVTYISGRADPLAAFFSYLSVIFFISHRDHGGLKKSFYYWGSVVFFVLGLLSKEATAILPLLIFICDYAKGSFSKKGAVKYVPFIAALLIYAFVRHAALIGVHGVFSVKNYLSIADRLLAIPVVILTYIKLLIFPVGLHMERNDVIFEVLGPAFTYTAITAFLLLLAMAIFLWIWRRRLKIAIFGALWFLVALLPMLNVALPLNALVAEHWLYLPSFGFFLISSAILTWMLGLKSIRLCIVSFIVVLCVLLGILTINQNYVWRNPIFFYKYTLRYAPLSSRLHTNLGVEYFIRGLYSEAEREHRRALAIEPAGAYTIYHYLDLGAALYMQGKEKEAFEVYAKAIGLSPRFPGTYWHLGNIYFDRNDFRRAAEFYEKAVELLPSNPSYWYSLGQAYDRGGKLSDAKNAYENAIRRYPYYEEAKASLKRIGNQLVDK